MVIAVSLKLIRFSVKHVIPLVTPRVSPMIRLPSASTWTGTGVRPQPGVTGPESALPSSTENSA